MSQKILIVDDEPHIRMLLEQTLEDFEDDGVELLFASDGAAALQTIRDERPDLVYLDVMMPAMNGFDVCRAVRSEAAIAETHIVILTAKGQEFDRRQGADVGADVFMTKPFDPSAVVAHTAQVLGL